MFGGQRPLYSNAAAAGCSWSVCAQLAARGLGPESEQLLPHQELKLPKTNCAALVPPIPLSLQTRAALESWEIMETDKILLVQCLGGENLRGFPLGYFPESSVG